MARVTVISTSPRWPKSLRGIDRPDDFTEENEIYTPKNRELVVESARIVADRLIERMAEEEEGGAPACPSTNCTA